MRPEKDEYNAFYENYIKLCPESDVIAGLQGEVVCTEHALGLVSTANQTVLHAPYTWSIRQVVGHMIDTERIFADRAHRISRSDSTPLPSFDENQYAVESNAANIELERLFKEFRCCRQANLLMLENLRPEQWTRRGTASNSGVSVRALAFMMLGHERHHMSIVRKRLGIDRAIV